MSKKLLSIMLAVVFTMSILLAGCGQKQTASTDTAGTKTETKTEAKPETKANNDIKVGFIYVGPIGDGGWSFAHNDGRLAVEKELGVKAVIRESVPEGPEVEKALKDMIDQGCKIIFATSLGYMKYVEKVAKEFPDVKFMHCSGDTTRENMTAYFGRMYEARYLSGIVAGLKTKSNKIGYVGAFDVPEVVRGINAFTLGVRSVNPDAKVIVRWTNTWYEPAKEKDAAKALLDEGADVIAQHQDTTGPQVAAEERGVWAIGYNTDSRNAAPKAYMTAPVWNWGPYYVKQVKAVMDGTWKSESYWASMKDGLVDLAPLTENAPADAKAKVEEAKKKIFDGSLNVFAGPIKDQTGAVKVAEGKAMTDKEMLEFNWFVEGVEGKISKK